MNPHPKFAPLRLLVLSAFLLTWTGCDLLSSSDDDPAIPAGVVVGNQGEFGAGDGSVTVYDPASNTSSTAVSNLESIVQSVEVIGNQLYVVANTGGRVDVYDVESFERIGMIEGLVSPRYIASAGGRLFITNLYESSMSYSGGHVTVVDPESLEALDEIAVGDNPDGIAAVGGRVFVANSAFGAGNTVSVIDAATADARPVEVDCDGPRWAEADADGDVFIFCTGQVIYDDSWNAIGSTDGAVIVLSGTSGEVVGRIDVDGRIGASEFGQDAYFDAVSERIFVLRSADDHFMVDVIDTRSNTISSSIGPFEGQIGAVAFDSSADELYLARINGFTNNGSVGIYNLDGELIRSFSTGIAPTSIRFLTD